MKDPTNEWRQILDERGQRLLPDRGGLTFKMERRIQALALWSAFLTIENATEANLIYDLKHDDEP